MTDHPTGKRITVMVAASYFYPKIGGLENYAYLLAKKLQESGRYRVFVVTSNYDRKGAREEVIDGMTVYRLPISFVLSNTPLNPFWYWSVKQIIEKERPDLVHLHSPVPYLPDIATAAAKGLPVVLTYHAGSMRKGSFLVDLLIGAYENIFLTMLFKRSDAIIPISQAFARKTYPQFVSKMSFIPTGVDLARFKKTPLPTDDVVTFVGRIERTSMWKGIEQLMQAMVIVRKTRPQAVLQIVGGGDALEHYKTRAQELGIANAVIFKGPQLGSDLVEAYERSSMVVLPSTSDAEAFSIVLVEAMASGRPIIATNIGGNPQVVQEGVNGLLVPPKDPEALAAAITRVLDDRAFAMQLAEGGALLAQKFSWDIQAKKYTDLFEGLVRKR